MRAFLKNSFEKKARTGLGFEPTELPEAVDVAAKGGRCLQGPLLALQITQRLLQIIKGFIICRPVALKALQRASQGLLGRWGSCMSIGCAQALRPCLVEYRFFFSLKNPKRGW